MPVATILCLANSRKLAGRCAAGLRLDTGGWVRMVSKLHNGILNISHLYLDNGNEAAVLDVLDIGLANPKPDIHQPENWLLDGSVWRLHGSQDRTPFADCLKKAIVPGPDVLRGTSDRVAWADLQVKHVEASLALVAPDELKLELIHKPNGRHQVRGRFVLQHCEFNLSMTDPVWEKRIHNEGNLCLRQSERKFLVTVSLGEPFNDYCYKVIAAVIFLPAALNQVL
jgi:hypothetical protein